MRIIVMAAAFLFVFNFSRGYPAESKSEPREDLEKIYSVLFNASEDIKVGNVIQSLRGYIYAEGLMSKLKSAHPDFEVKQVDEIIGLIEKQIKLLRDKVQSDGLVEYKGKTVTIDQLGEIIKKGKELQDRWERFIKYQEIENRTKADMKFMQDMKRVNQQNRLQEEARRDAENRRLQEELRRQKEERREAEERRRRYEQQTSGGKY